MTRRAYLISLIAIAVIAGFLARSDADTSAELMPLVAGVSWVEGRGPSIDSDILPVRVRPTHVIQARNNLRPRTSPVMMLYYGGMCRMYRDSVGRSLDGTDLPKLIWLINFFGVLLWAFLLFGGMVRLARIWGLNEGAKPIWASWAAMSGSMAFGWFGVVSPYLPVAALACWTLALLLEARSSGKIFIAGMAGILAGLSGAWEPSGWIWIVWGLFLMFVSPWKGIAQNRQYVMITVFGIMSAVGVAIALIGNSIFFGSPLPVQWMPRSGVELDAVEDIFRLVWHNTVGFNGLLWLAPLVLPGLIALSRSHDKSVETAVLRFMLGLAALTLFVWGISDDAGLRGEINAIDPAFHILPVELSNGEFGIVLLSGESGTMSDYRAYFEQLIQRKDIFYSTISRSPGMPVFLPIALILSLFGLCNAGMTRFLDNLSWVGVRWSFFLGLIMSRAPYGMAPGVALYLMGRGIDSTGMPIMGSLLAVSLKLSEIWPSGVVTF
ncbi:MAG TPA: hypothetical protein ENN67_04390 [Firmicutes bacterium]|nr:hypothetical protein [Bacillota bacterium]